MEGRDPEAHAIIGFNGTGKSTFFIENVLPAYDLRSQKVIIINNATPKPFENFPRISSPEGLKRKWRGVLLYHNPAGFKQTLNDIYLLAQQGYVSNGAVMVDDCSKYIDYNPPEAVKNFLIDRKAFNLDLFLTTHALGFLPKFCRLLMNTITIFRTTESFKNADELKQLKYPNSEALFTAWQQVTNAPQVKGRIQKNITIATGI